MLFFFQWAYATRKELALMTSDPYNPGHCTRPTHHLRLDGDVCAACAGDALRGAFRRRQAGGGAGARRALDLYQLIGEKMPAAPYPRSWNDRRKLHPHRPQDIQHPTDLPGELRRRHRAVADRLDQRAHQPRQPKSNLLALGRGRHAVDGAWRQPADRRCLEP